MNLDEHLLVAMDEEATELIVELLKMKVAISKALRFGLDDDWRDENYSESPRKLIQKEFNDVYAVAELLAQRGVLEWPLLDMNAVELKKIKVRKFLEYARERGTVGYEEPGVWPR